MFSPFDDYIEYFPRRPDPRDSRMMMGASASFYIELYRTESLSVRLLDLTEVLGSDARMNLNIIHYTRNKVLGIGVSFFGDRDFCEYEYGRTRRLVATLDERKCN